GSGGVYDTGYRRPQGTNHRDGGGPDREHDHEFLRPGYRRTDQEFAVEWAESLLMRLSSDVISNRANTADSSQPSFSIAGERPDSNRFTINGMDYVGNNGGGVYTSPQGISGSLLGVDAVREFNVLGHTYGAEYGKRAGAQVTIVTTSGTNQWRGAVFEYLRHR